MRSRFLIIILFVWLSNSTCIISTCAFFIRDDSALPVSFACNFLKERERRREQEKKEREREWGEKKKEREKKEGKKKMSHEEAKRRFKRKKIGRQATKIEYPHLLNRLSRDRE